MCAGPEAGRGAPEFLRGAANNHVNAAAGRFIGYRLENRRKIEGRRLGRKIRDRIFSTQSANVQELGADIDFCSHVHAVWCRMTGDFLLRVRDC